MPVKTESGDEAEINQLAKTIAHQNKQKVAQAQAQAQLLNQSPFNGPVTFAK